MAYRTIQVRFHRSTQDLINYLLNSRKLVAGANQLNTGMKSYAGGVSQLNSGLSQFSVGVRMPIQAELTNYLLRTNQLSSQSDIERQYYSIK